MSAVPGFRRCSRLADDRTARDRHDWSMRTEWLRRESVPAGATVRGWAARRSGGRAGTRCAGSAHRRRSGTARCGPHSGRVGIAPTVPPAAGSARDGSGCGASCATLARLPRRSESGTPLRAATSRARAATSSPGAVSATARKPPSRAASRALAPAVAAEILTQQRADVLVGATGEKARTEAVGLLRQLLLMVLEQGLKTAPLMGQVRTKLEGTLAVAHGVGARRRQLLLKPVVD